MTCVSCDIDYACTTLGLFVFFPWGIPQLQSDWSLSCDHGLDYASLCENNNSTNYLLCTSSEVCEGVISRVLRGI